MCFSFHTLRRKPLLCTAFQMNYASGLHNSVKFCILSARNSMPNMCTLCMFSSQPYLPIVDPDLPPLTGTNLRLDVVATISGAFLTIIYDLISLPLVFMVFCFCAYDSGPPSPAAYARASLHCVIHTCTHYQYIYLFLF